MTRLLDLTLMLAALAIPVVTAISDPLITVAPRQPRLLQKKTSDIDSDPDFIGYLLGEEGWFGVTCDPGLEYEIRSGLGYCCDPEESECARATGCGNGLTVLYDSPGEDDCSSGYYCATVTVFPQKGETESAHSLIRCFSRGHESVAEKTWYRETFAITTGTDGEIATVSGTSTGNAAGADNTESVDDDPPEEQDNEDQKDVGYMIQRAPMLLTLGLIIVVVVI